VYFLQKIEHNIMQILLSELPSVEAVMKLPANAFSKRGKHGLTVTKRHMTW